MTRQEQRIQMMKEGSIPKTLFQLSAPTIIAMLVLAFYYYVDSIFVGLLKEESALAAIQVIMPAFQLIGAVGLTFGIGAASIISRRLGEERLTEARKTASVAFYLSLVMGILLSIFGIIFINTIVKFLGATDASLKDSISYGRIILGGSVFQVLNMALNNILRAEGAAKESGIIQIGGAVLNMILDPIFIFTLKMGVTGAAAATILAQTIVTLLLLSLFVRKKSILHLSIKDFHPTPKRLSDIMVIGLPTFIRQLISGGSFMIINILASQYGDAALAAIGVSMRTLMLVFMTLFGLCQGLQPLIGFNFGAKNLERMKKALHVGLIWTLILSIISSIIFIIGAEPLTKLFLHDNKEALAIGKISLLAIGIGLVPAGLSIIYGNYFQAVGAGREAFILALCQQGLILIPLLYLFDYLWKLNGMLFAQPVAYFLSFLLTLLLKWRVDKRVKEKIS